MITIICNLKVDLSMCEPHHISQAVQNFDLAIALTITKYANMSKISIWVPAGLKLPNIDTF